MPDGEWRLCDSLCPGATELPFSSEGGDSRLTLLGGSQHTLSPKNDKIVALSRTGQLGSNA